LSPWTPEEYAKWERISTENMIHFYAPELKKISEGARAHTLLSKSLIVKLRELNILTEYSGKRSGRVVTLSEKGKRLIGITESET